MSKQLLYLFFHGGPGFNSLAEEQLFRVHLEKKDAQVEFWQEPSSKDQDFVAETAFQRLLDSADTFLQRYSFHGKEIILIAHSFGSHAVTYLAQKYPQVKKVILLAPSLNMPRSEDNIFKLAYKDFVNQGDSIRAVELLGVLSNLLDCYDQTRERGIRLSLEDEQLFTHYWNDKKIMAEYFKYFMSNGQGLDLNSLIAVRRSMFKLPYSQIKIPCVVIFGQDDKVIDIEVQFAKVCKYYVSAKKVIIEKSAHYPHLEFPQSVLREI